MARNHANLDPVELELSRFNQVKSIVTTCM